MTPDQVSSALTLIETVPHVKKNLDEVLVRYRELKETRSDSFLEKLDAICHRDYIHPIDRSGSLFQDFELLHSLSLTRLGIASCKEKVMSDVLHAHCFDLYRDVCDFIHTFNSLLGKESA